MDGDVALLLETAGWVLPLSDNGRLPFDDSLSFSSPSLSWAFSSSSKCTDHYSWSL